MPVRRNRANEPVRSDRRGDDLIVDGNGISHISGEEFGTRIMSWGPFAEGRNSFFSNPILAEIGHKYGKSVAQVALRWLIQCGVIIIPKSTHVERMRQNFDIFDFSLSDGDMAAIAMLDTGRSLFFDHHDAVDGGEQPFVLSERLLISIVCRA